MTEPSFTFGIHAPLKAEASDLCVSFRFGIMQRGDIYCPPHVSAATARAFNRAMQAKQTDTPGALEYRGWRIAQNRFGVWQYQSEEITGDRDPCWMYGSASSLFDAMDAIDDAIAENAHPMRVVK